VISYQLFYELILKIKNKYTEEKKNKTHDPIIIIIIISLLKILKFSFYVQKNIQVYLNFFKNNTKKSLFIFS
jgi:hypothetical protein